MLVDENLSVEGCCVASQLIATISDTGEQWEQKELRNDNKNVTNDGAVDNRPESSNACIKPDLLKLAIAFMYEYRTLKRLLSLPSCSTSLLSSSSNINSSCCTTRTRGIERRDDSDDDINSGKDVRIAGWAEEKKNTKDNINYCKNPSANISSHPATCPATDTNITVAPVRPPSNKCLICRDDSCRGNLYCRMLPPPDSGNDFELITLNRKKSIVQNRRKSALNCDGSDEGDVLAVMRDVNANSSGIAIEPNGIGDSVSEICCRASHTTFYPKEKCSPPRTTTSQNYSLLAERCLCRRAANSSAFASSSDNNETSGHHGSTTCCRSFNYCSRPAFYSNCDLTADDYSCEYDDSVTSIASLSRYTAERDEMSLLTTTATDSNEDRTHVSTTSSLCRNSRTVGNSFCHTNTSKSSEKITARPKSIFRYHSRASTLSTSSKSVFERILLTIFSIMLMNMSLSTVVAAQRTNSTELTGTGVCPSIDIRNDPQHLRNLSGCRVIEGFLVITLMDTATKEDFDMHVFPELTEITDFLLIYRVNGLQSLGKIFPNLTVIRGNSLFDGYALVVFENANMDELGLTTLSAIVRGGVRIEKNPSMCFVDTIDWSRIAVNATEDLKTWRNNKPKNECPLCSAGKYEGDCSVTSAKDSADKLFCWNLAQCQKVCPLHCGLRGCNSKGVCCPESCLGSCSEDGQTCMSCRNAVAYGMNGERKCVEECPINTFKHMNQRCVTTEECLNLPKPLRSSLDSRPYVPFKKLCIHTCPPGYEKSNTTCVLCKGQCSKSCEGTTVTSIRDAEKLTGCTYIKGNLMISIRQVGPHLVEELDSALSAITEISGYLKIVRTFSIVSLSFFRSLRYIRGEYLEDSRFALYVLDNQNLQNLWGENGTVEISHGRVFFHFNPKLCYNKIEALKPYIADFKNNMTFDPAEVARDSNGDRVACDVSELIIQNVTTTETAAIVKLVPFVFEDPRVFLGYQYFYMEAPFRNVSIYENRHGCGYDSWNVDDDSNKDNMHLFSHLKPYTQYAFYVKTYTIASEKRGAQSKLDYFRTQPSTPDPVRNLHYEVLNYSSIRISWLPPRLPNGNLTEYHFSAEIVPESPSILDQRNYCTEPIKPADHRTESNEPIENKPKTELINEETCKSICKKWEKASEHQAKVSIEALPARENEIDFEDSIQNFVYVKRAQDPEEKRSKRSVGASVDTNPSDILPVQNNNDKQKSAPVEELRKEVEDGYFKIYGDIVNSTVKTFTFTNLKHFSKYKIYVRACREGTGDRCSTESRIFTQTKKKVGADEIQNLTAQIETINNTRNNVRLTWNEPGSPNGLIVAYSIVYYPIDAEHGRRVEKCITYREYKNSTKGFLLYDLDAGNYSVKVMATTIAGDGGYSEQVFFYINKSTLSWYVWLIIALSIILLAAVGFVLTWHFRKRCLPPPDDLKLFTSVNPEYISMQYTPDEWEISRDKIIQIRELGQGSFGMVYEGLIKDLYKNGEDTPCAIKTVNENATDRERINFLKEASVMKGFDTFHVVRLLGVVSRDQPTLVIMELMANGDLKGYLRSNRPDQDLSKVGDVQGQPPTLKRILQMAIEIADGMAYLAFKKFVHRDLAARNCMVADDLTVKIGDFGMTRDIYETDYYRKGTKGLLPVRWMSPESLKDGVFTSASDVFSYGVVLWEMATLASQPYQGLSNDQVLRYVIDGGVMERPENCPDKLYNLMRRCWQHRPSARPTFMEIIEHLLDDVSQKFREVSFFHTDVGQEQYKQMQTITDIDDTTPLRMDEDDYKLEVGENYLMDRTDSHLVPDETQHSPYSRGSGIVIDCMPDDTSRPSYENSSPSTLTTNNKDPTSITTSTAATVQSFSNSLVPSRLRRMWRSAFSGNGNSNYSNRSCNGAGGSESEMGIVTSAERGSTMTTTMAAGAESATTPTPELRLRAKPIAGTSTTNNSGSGSNSSNNPINTGLSSILSGLKGQRSMMGKDFSTKNNPRRSHETITNPLLNDVSFDEITSSSIANVPMSGSQLTCNQSTDDAHLSTNSLSDSSNVEAPFENQIQSQHTKTDVERRWPHSNGYIPRGNMSRPVENAARSRQEFFAAPQS